jgi:succinate dehydrogenase/fumarate reductase flavoprotein subunit
MSENKITRRQFIKGAAIAGAAAAATSVLGSTPTVDAQTTTIKWDKEVDVVVVGAGVGLAAAIEAKTAGADVLIVEKDNHIGGLWISAGGSCTMGGNNVVQQKEGEKDDNETWFQDEMWSNEYRGVPEIIRVLVARGAETIKWMQDLGMVWGPLAAGVLRPPIKRGIAPAQAPGVYAGGAGTPNSGICWIQVWEKKLKALGVPILLKHRMTRIYRDGTGPVTGIAVKNETGTMNIKAKKAVILCAGTWTDNARFAGAWDPRIVGQDCYGDGGIPADGTFYTNSAGDGHFAAEEIGAGFSDMSFHSYIYLFSGARSYWGWGPEPLDWSTNKNYAAGKGVARTADFYQRSIFVKNDGARYFNEAEGARAVPPGRGAYSENPEYPFTASYLALPQPRNVWSITDADGAEFLKFPIEALKNPNPKVGQMFDPTCIAIADSIEELAKKMGIDAAKLQATITKYNGFVDAGKDADFAKPMPFTKIVKPPFYGLKLSLIRHTQRNGLRVNTKSQVIEQSDLKDGLKPVSIDQEKVIPHLYAAGELGNALGWRRVHNTLGHYTTAARIAGENAVKETPVT